MFSAVKKPLSMAMNSGALLVKRSIPRLTFTFSFGAAFLASLPPQPASASIMHMAINNATIFFMLKLPFSHATEIITLYHSTLFLANMHELFVVFY